jgi:hypothetical protein
MKQMLGVFNARDYKKFNFPFMMFESSEEPTRNFEGFDTILQFLIENNFIHDYRSHTAYEKDGIKFVENFETCFNNLMKNFGNLFSFYFKSTNFKEARYWYHPHKDNYVYRNRIISRLFRLLTCSIKDYKYYIQRNNKKKLFIAENEKKLQELVSTWLGRLNNKPFHGGDIPDAADFKLYSMIRKFSNCRKINFKLKKLSEENIEFMKFEDWSSKMFILCSRDNYYNIKDVGYNYNRFLDEEIISNEKINKPFTEAQQSEDDSEFKNSSSKSNVINSNKTPIMGIFGNRIKRKKINF